MAISAPDGANNMNQIAIDINFDIKDTEKDKDIYANTNKIANKD